MKRGVIVFLLVFLSVSPAIYAASPRVSLTLTDVPTFFSTTTQIHFNPGTSTAFVTNQDIIVNYIVDTAYPQIYSLTSDNIGCSSNGYGDFTACTQIKLGYRLEGGSTYRIDASLLADFDPASIVQLEDKTLGVFQNLRVDPYIFQATQFEHSETRFVLHISYPPSFTTIAAGCGNDDGTVSVYQEACIVWDSCIIRNSIGQWLQSYININGNFSFSGLQEGLYSVEFRIGFYSTQQSILLEGHQIQATISAPTLNGFTGEAMIFSAVADNADDYAWSFGDSSEINGVANPDYTYLEPGTYTVTVVCTNIYGCSDTATVTVVIAQGTSVQDIRANNVRVYTQSKNLNIYFNAQPDAANEWMLYNLGGKKLVSNQFVSSHTSVDLHHLSAGMYILAIKSKESVFSRRIILTE